MSEPLAVFEFDQNGEMTASEAVIHAVADAANVDPLELDPLYSVLDPDALDTIFSPRSNGQLQDGDIQITFPVSDYYAAVWSYGLVNIMKNDNRV